MTLEFRVSEREISKQNVSAPFCEGTPTPVQSLVTVQEEQHAMLECETSQYRQVATSITFEWFKNGVKLGNPSSSPVRLRDGRYRGTLTLTSVNRTDASSFYTCKARGIRGLSGASTTITLHVTCKFFAISVAYDLLFLLDAPHNVRVRSNFSAFVKEGRIILSCIVKANPLPHQYSWWKDGQLQAESGSQFVILNSSFSGNETYKCAANNSLGSSMSEIFVISLSKPRLLAVFTTYEIRITAGNEYGYGPNSSTIKVQTAEGGTWR